MSLPSGGTILWALICAVGAPWGSVAMAAQAPAETPAESPAASPAAAPDPNSAPAPGAQPAPVESFTLPLPKLHALGVSQSWRPEYPGAQDSVARTAPQFVVRWGRLTLSNGGALASRAGENAESGVLADLLSKGPFSIRASLRLDAGRKSDEVERLVGLHDVPSHLRSRVLLGWTLHPQWELQTAWRADVSGRGTGQSLDFTLLHQWRPDFLDHRRWRLSAGVGIEWLDSTRANLLHGVTPEDARRTPYRAHTVGAGVAEARAFLNWRRELDGPWLAFGSVSFSRMQGQAARSPLVDRPQGLSLSAGVGRRF